MKTVIIKDKALEISLPKWPGMVLHGKRVTKEQAAEIIICTDHHMPDMSYAGNDENASQEINDIFGIPAYKKYGGDDKFDYQGHHLALEGIRQKLGMIQLSYLNTDRIISCFVGGPNGWCNWGGDVFSNKTNIGKWPDVEDVADDWGTIVERFPFLELKCTLFDKETCEDNPQPLVTFDVKDRHVTVSRASDQGYDTPVSDIEGDMMSLFTPGREIGIMPAQLEEHIKTIWGSVPQYDDYYQTKAEREA